MTASRSSRALVVVVVLVAASAAVFAVAALLQAAPRPAAPPMRWSPPVADPVPDVLARREPLPFCGVAEGGSEERVYRCLQDAVEAHRAAEAGVVGTSDFGQRITIIRLLADSSVELFFLGELETEGHDGWLLVRCGALAVDLEPRFVVRPDACGAASPL